MRNLFLIAISSLALSCGGTPTLTIDVDLAVNPTSEGNPLQKIEADRLDGKSLGILFRFTPLQCPPSSVSATVGNPVQYPPLDANGLTTTGFSALESEFNIDTSQLLEFTYYRVEMLSQTPNNPPVITHLGVGDCPVNLSQNPQVPVTVCFGEQGSNPLCPGLIPFSQCGVTPEFCH